MATIARFVAGRPPHALLIAGPASVGKTTLALDLAAGLLCEALVPADRPCGVCRSCRRVRSRSHPDLHWLAPVEPGRQIVIGGEDGRSRGVRQLAAELALAPLEGPVRVAVVEAAERMNEAAQNAFLKTLEEPPPASVIVLCADAPDRLLPTIRSRCATLRLGLVGARTIEALLVESELAEPPLAARLARIAAGRPGLAVAYALAPEALAARGEAARLLLDLRAADPGARLAALRSLVGTALEASEALAGAAELDPAGPRGRRSGGRATSGSPAGSAEPGGPSSEPATEPPSPEPGEGGDGEAVAVGTERVRASTTERRAAARWLVEAWRDLARDLLLVTAGRPGLVRDVGLLDELTAAAARLDRDDLVRFVEKSVAAEAALEANASPELVLDVLALAWLRPSMAA